MKTLKTIAITCLTILGLIILWLWYGLRAI